MSESPKHTLPSLVPMDDVGQDFGLLGTKNTDAKELTRDEFLRMAQSLKFSETEMAKLRALYRDDFEGSALLDNVSPSIQY